MCSNQFSGPNVKNMSHGDFRDNFFITYLKIPKKFDTRVLTSISFSAVPAFDSGYALLTGKGREYMYPIKICPILFPV